MSLRRAGQPPPLLFQRPHPSPAFLAPIAFLLCSHTSSLATSLVLNADISSSDYVQSDVPVEQALANPVSISLPQHRPGPEAPQWKVPVSAWPNVLRRVVENQEPLRKVAGDDGVSHETVRRTVRTACKRLLC